ncbi:MAG: 50S ribosomal protein L30 [Geobacter sp.]|nr:MAG: 50S ribosomal protein L30 [Geobacter sp.]
MSQEITIKLVRSHIGKPADQRAVLNGMGLNKLNKSVVLKDTPEIRGMIRKVSHLVNVTE